jgi:hypothetical protein
MSLRFENAENVFAPSDCRWALSRSALSLNPRCFQIDFHLQFIIRSTTLRVQEYKCSGCCTGRHYFSRKAILYRWHFVSADNFFRGDDLSRKVESVFVPSSAHILVYDCFSDRREHCQDICFWSLLCVSNVSAPASQDSGIQGIAAIQTDEWNVQFHNCWWLYRRFQWSRWLVSDVGSVPSAILISGIEIVGSWSCDTCPIADWNFEPRSKLSPVLDGTLAHWASLYSIIIPVSVATIWYGNAAEWRCYDGRASKWPWLLQGVGLSTFASKSDQKS